MMDDFTPEEEKYLDCAWLKLREHFDEKDGVAAFLLFRNVALHFKQAWKEQKP